MLARISGLILFLLLMAAPLESQELAGTFVPDTMGVKGQAVPGTAMATHGQKRPGARSVSFGQGLPDSTTVIYGWGLGGYATPMRRPIDTLVPDLHRFNPKYRYSPWNSDLGNLGSPVIQDGYLDRLYDENIPFLSVFRPYLFTYDDVEYINTKKPFSHIFYTNAGQKRDKEETMDVFHSQNISQYFNFGFKYNLYATKGQYLYQEIKKNSFSFFASYTRKNWQTHATMNINQYKTGESGGVIDSAYRENYYRFNKEIPVLFEGGPEPGYDANVHNKIRYLDFLVSNRGNLNGLWKVDTAGRQKKGIGDPIVSYVIRGRRVSKVYTDTDPLANTYYEHIYSNGSSTYDSSANFELVNTLRLDFKTTLAGKVRVGVYAGINHEFQNITLYSALDTNTSLTKSDSAIFINLAGGSLRGYTLMQALSNYFLSGGLYGNLFDRVGVEADGLLYMLGSKAGQMRLRGAINMEVPIFGYPLGLDVEGSFENRQAGYMLENYVSNHLLYNENFASTKRVLLSGALSAPSNFFRIWADYALLSGEIYWEATAVPSQYNNPLSIVRLGLEKEFKLGEFHSKNKLVDYLFVENENVVQVPKLAVYNTTYIDHTWHFDLTGGELRTMLGFDLYYSTGYNGYAYDAVTSRFYQQDVVKVGGYPWLDVFLNIKIKQVRGFLKLENLNSELFEGDYYTAIYYPQNTMTFKFGVAWAFYN